MRSQRLTPTVFILLINIENIQESVEVQKTEHHSTATLLFSQMLSSIFATAKSISICNGKNLLF